MTRWLCIGTVRADTRLYGGHPGQPPARGYWINWRGRTDWCQPRQFVTWDGLLAAVTVRLRAAGLAAVAYASPLPRREFQPLWVEVRRATLNTEQRTLNAEH